MPNTDTNTVSVYVPKGGVGKTTTAAHLAAAAAREHGLEVLLIDLAGTQNDLATQFGLADDVEEPDAPLSAVFGSDWGTIRDAIPDVVDRMTFSTGEGPDLIPADQGLSGAEANLSNVPLEERFGYLREFVQEDLDGMYDLVLLDLPGGEDNITLNGLAASQNIVVPIKPGAFELAQLHALVAPADAETDEGTTLGDFRRTHGIEVDVASILPTIFDGRTNQSERFVFDVQEEYPGRVADEPVPKTQDIPSAQERGETLFASHEDELYATGKRALQAYRAATDDLLRTIND